MIPSQHRALAISNVNDVKNDALVLAKMINLRCTQSKVHAFITAPTLAMRLLSAAILGSPNAKRESPRLLRPQLLHLPLQLNQLHDMTMLCTLRSLSPRFQKLPQGFHGRPSLLLVVSAPTFKDLVVTTQLPVLLSTPCLWSSAMIALPPTLAPFQGLSLLPQSHVLSLRPDFLVVNVARAVVVPTVVSSTDFLVVSAARTVVVPTVVSITLPVSLIQCAHASRAQSTPTILVALYRAGDVDVTWKLKTARLVSMNSFALQASNCPSPCLYLPRILDPTASHARKPSQSSSLADVAAHRVNGIAFVPPRQMDPVPHLALQAV